MTFAPFRIPLATHMLVFTWLYRESPVVMPIKSRNLYVEGSTLSALTGSFNASSTSRGPVLQPSVLIMIYAGLASDVFKRYRVSSLAASSGKTRW